MKPNFIGIGAQKSASTWLYDILADHPEVVVSTSKELDFFSYKYERGHHWYEAQFPYRNSALSVGEISPSYLNEASVPERVKHFDPNIRILLSLRDPVERALSQHRHMIRTGMIAERDIRFEDALSGNPSYVEQGMYGRHLLRWLEHFPREHVLVVLMEDIARTPSQIARSVYEFLGVNDGHLSSALNQKSNPSYVVRSRILDNAVSTLRTGAARVGFESVWRGIARIGLQRAYRRINRKLSSAAIPPPLPDTITSLRQIFREDTLLLQDILHKDLGAWL